MLDADNWNVNSVSLQRPQVRPLATSSFAREAIRSTPSSASATPRAAEGSAFSSSPSRSDSSTLTRLGSLFAPVAPQAPQAPRTAREELTLKGTRKGEELPPPSGEDPFQGLRDQALLKAIQQSSAGKDVVSYNEARKIIFGDLDVHNGKVKCVYTGREIAGGKLPNSSDMNVEHTWPQSKGAKGDAKSDLHHLFPTDSKANSTRGSFPFGKVEKVQWSQNGSKFGLDAQGRKVFEPPDEHKGNVARALFYFSAEYGKAIPDAEEAVLREWNNLDTVDAAELARNRRISEIQGNVNQFVEHSNLAERIQNF